MREHTPRRYYSLVVVVVACVLTSPSIRADQTTGAIEALIARAETLQQTSKGDEALEVAVQAVAQAEATLAAEDPLLAAALYARGISHYLTANFEAAEGDLTRALQIRQRVPASNRADLAQVLNDLGQVYQAHGKLHLVEPLLAQALQLREELHGPTHPEVANALNNLAGYFFTVGQYTRARELFERTLAVRTELSGPDTLAVAQSLNNLGLVVQKQGDLAGAAGLFDRALTMRERNNASPQEIARTLNNLASVRQEQGTPESAQPLYERALGLYQSALGSEHPLIGQTLSNLAVSLFLQGKHADAETAYRRALDIRERSLGPSHPDVGVTLSALSAFYQGTGRPAAALPLQARALEVMERNLQSTLAVGSESQKTSYLQTFADAVDITFSLRSQLGSANRAASDVAAALLLRRKGRVLDVLTHTSDVIRRNPNLDRQQSLRELAQARSQLARMTLSGSADVSDYRARVETLEAVLSKGVPAAPEPTLQEVQAAIPLNAALVEFVAYRPFDATQTRRELRFGAPRYVAFVIGRTGEGLWVELGPVDAIDADLERHRQAVTTGKDADALATRLYERLIEPIESALAGKDRLFISPDGALNLLPFAALRDRKPRYLLETYTITYLTSGRDLLRPSSAILTAPRITIFANPTFQRRSAGKPASWTFAALPGAEQEARAIAKLIANSTLYVGEAASETRLKNLPAPEILHIATHGFFAQSRLPQPAPNSRGLVAVGGSNAVTAPDELGSLMRSGLAFADANTGGTADDDGILTALEAMSLDLRGTRLVVLSACDTGIGEVRVGESVYGLRRVLTLAGAESQIMTLWEVGDVATRDLMTAFYRHLTDGFSAADALRSAQLEMVKGTRWSKPRFWAPFVAAGQTETPIFTAARARDVTQH